MAFDIASLFGGGEKEQGGFDMGSMPPEAATRMFQDPQFLASAASAFLKRGLPMGIQWLERAHNAAKENAFEAIGHLEAGDPQAAVAAWNKSGKFTDATGATKNADGTWTIARSSGQSVTVNPTELRRSLLSPKDYFAQVAKEKELQIQEDYHKGVLKHYERADANAEEAAALRAQAVEDRNAYLRDKLATDAERAAAAAAMRGAGGTRGSGTGAGHGGGIKIDKVYDDALKHARENDVGMPAAQYARDEVLRATADLGEDPQKKGAWRVIGTMPNGQQTVLAEYNTEEEARAAHRIFTAGGPLPTNSGPIRARVGNGPIDNVNPSAPRRLSPAQIEAAMKQRPDLGAGTVEQGSDVGSPPAKPPRALTAHGYYLPEEGAPRRVNQPPAEKPNRNAAQIADMDRLIQAEAAKPNPDVAKIQAWTQARAQLVRTGA